MGAVTGGWCVCGAVGAVGAVCGGRRTLGSPSAPVRPGRCRGCRESRSAQQQRPALPQGWRGRAATRAAMHRWWWTLSSRPVFHRCWGTCGCGRPVSTWTCRGRAALRARPDCSRGLTARAGRAGRRLPASGRLRACPEMPGLPAGLPPSGVRLCGLLAAWRPAVCPSSGGGHGGGVSGWGARLLLQRLGVSGACGSGCPSPGGRVRPAGFRREAQGLARRAVRCPPSPCAPPRPPPGAGDAAGRSGAAEPWGEVPLGASAGLKSRVVFPMSPLGGAAGVAGGRPLCRPCSLRVRRSGRRSLRGALLRPHCCHSRQVLVPRGPAF